MELGIATTLAVVFHELPQEIGDFAILINAKMKKRKAIFFKLSKFIISFPWGHLVYIF